MSPRSARLRGWSLLALCAVLSALIALELEQAAGLADAPGAPNEASAAQPSAQARALPGESIALAPVQQFDEIVERTLFDASRRAAPEESDEPAAPAELRDLILTGVVITPEAKLALFRDKTPSQVIRLGPGDAFGKWLLEEVRDDGVTLRRGQARRELRLYEVEDPARLKNASQAQTPMAPRQSAAWAAPAADPSAAQAQPGDSPAKAPRRFRRAPRLAAPSASGPIPSAEKPQEK